MATTILLIRHAAHDRPGPLLVGRDDDVALSAAGRAAAHGLASCLARHALAAVVTSPSRRCRQTAEIIAGPHGLKAEADPDVDELDFGTWRGRALVDLEGDPAWRLFNGARGSAHIPGGESMAAVQARVDRAVHALAERYPGRLVALVSHGDVIRTAVCQVLGLAVDLMLRFEVAPASITTIELGAVAPRLLALNWIPDQAPGLSG